MRIFGRKNDKANSKPARTTLQFKLSMIFFGVMTVSALLSCTIIILVFGPFMKENMQSKLENMAQSIQKMEKTKKFSTDDIADIISSSSYTVKKVEKYEYEVTAYYAEIKEKGYYIHQSGFIPEATLVCRAGNAYISVSTFSSESMTWILILILLVAFFICILIGTIITAAVSRTILQPIHDLNRATSEVARGHFNVRVKVPSDREYGALARNFNKMAEELGEIETLSGDFISSVSHEFKTPLASIQGFAKLLQDKNLSEEDREEYTQVIIDETSRLSKLSSNILKLTKLENQRTIGKNTRFSLDEQIRSIILILEPEWSKKNIDLDIDLEGINYLGNEELMAQIWQNIINNAIKFTPVNGKIIIRLFRSDTGIVTKISDNGPNIPKDKIDKIFDKFYQADKSRATEGNGLGLALVKRVVDLCKGSVGVENLYEGGVCFTVELPYIIEDMR